MNKNSPRAELLQLHRRLYLKNRQVIADSVIPEDRSFAAYEARYKRAVSSYQKIVTVDDVEKKIAVSDIVYVGDYHTLNQSQRSFLRVLRSFVKKSADFVIGFEIIRTRHQPILDRYMRGRLSDDTFLKKIGFREHWFFDLWENFRPLFDFARYHKIPIYGIEGDGEGGRLARRDRETAGIIHEIRRKNPRKKIFVFVGDLHLAPSHLPREVSNIFRKGRSQSSRSLGRQRRCSEKTSLKTVTLFQNSDAIYWKLAAKGKEDSLLVQIAENQFCRMHTPPIIGQQSYLNWLEHEEGVFDYADAKQTFIGYLERIADFLGIRLPSDAEEVEVFTCGDLSFLKRLRETKAFSPRELKEIKRQILNSESYYIPKKKFVYLANVSVNHAAEEASHTLKHLCTGDEFPRPMQDAFYANALHEALGFFGSKIINPNRKCLHPSDAATLVRYLEESHGISARALQYQVAKLFLEHRNPFQAGKIKALSVDLFLGVTHALGYFLGERIFYGLLSGFVTKEGIRSLFYDPMEEEGEPLRRYLELDKKLKKVKLPKKI
ncbi:MAG: ChaN family lipoprotein [Deltaproteobacteria bacterium]|nr:ChaN family lipoprotein [Deltaproteobacteria bacterium]